MQFTLPSGNISVSGRKTDPDFPDEASSKHSRYPATVSLHSLAQRFISDSSARSGRCHHHDHHHQQHQQQLQEQQHQQPTVHSGLPPLPPPHGEGVELPAAAALGDSQHPATLPAVLTVPRCSRRLVPRGTRGAYVGASVCDYNGNRITPRRETRACCLGRARRSPLFTPSVCVETRYRKIEHLTLFVQTGTVNADTNYFVEPMSRRLLSDGALSRPDGVVTTNPREVGTVNADWDDMERELVRRVTVVPLIVLRSKRQFDRTAGQVKPYATGRANAPKMGQAIDPTATESALDTFILRMQCQRPFQGLHSAH